PMTKVLRDEVGLSLTRIDNAVSARSATPELSALLQVEVLSPILQSDNVTWGEGDEAVDVARISYPGDRFTFAVSVDLP
ncbi:MAG: UTRA domain-containing protein, partial [Pseudonocardia sp.]